MSKKILLLADLNKKIPKKFTKRKRDPYFKQRESPTDEIQPDKRQLHKKVRHSCKRLIEEAMRNDQD